MPKAVEWYCVTDRRSKIFEKYADITVCEDNQKLEDTIESVLDALGE